MPETQGHEPVAGVAHKRRPRVADQGNPLTFFHRDDQLGRPRHFVVLMIADQRFVNVVMRKQFLCMSRIFAGDLVGFAKCAQSAQRNVFQIANWSPDQEEASRGLH